MVNAVERLVAGHQSFRSRYYSHRPERMRELAAEGQHPEVMLIACVDSRVDPALVLDTEPGELFIVRNVANLVPPYGPDQGLHGTSAALEYGVRDLKVKNIIVLGHSGCGGIEALREAMAGGPQKREFMAHWMDIVADACACMQGAGVPSSSEVEREALQISLRNLNGFPWVAAGIEAGTLDVRGWWVDLQNGQLCEIEPETGVLRDVVTGEEVVDGAL